jgi:hypothetical protein
MTQFIETPKPPIALLKAFWIMRVKGGHWYTIQPSERCKPEDHGAINPHVVQIEDESGAVIWRRDH